VWLQPIRKSIVFVIDTSGSMERTKMQQAKSAFAFIVDQLDEHDLFTVVSFSTDVTVWKEELVDGSDAKEDAVSYIEDLSADGSTNLNGAVLKGLSLIEDAPDDTARLLVLLTDGQPTVGVTDARSIRANIRSANNKQTSIFCLGFGFTLDYNLLRAIAAENAGFDRRIYEDKDSVQQMTGFYDEISAPLLKGVSSSYWPQVVNSNTLTRTTFSHLFKGSELVVAGQFNSNVQSMTAMISATSACACSISWTKQFAWGTANATATVPVERLWAFLTIQQLLKQAIIENEVSSTLPSTPITPVQHKIQDMALQYQFVTPFTSIIIAVSNKSEEDNGPKTVTEDSQMISSNGTTNKHSLVGFLFVALFYFFLEH